MMEAQKVFRFLVRVLISAMVLTSIFVYAQGAQISRTKCIDPGSIENTKNHDTCARGFTQPPGPNIALKPTINGIQISKPKPIPEPDFSKEQVFWNHTKAIGSKQALKTFLNIYPKGNYADLAKAYIVQLESADNDIEEKKRRALDALQAIENKKGENLETEKVATPKQLNDAEVAIKNETERLRVEDSKSEKLRTDAIQRMKSQVLTTNSGNSNSIDQAPQRTGPSSNYAARVVAAIRPNISIIKDLSRRLNVEYDIYTDASGKVTSAKLRKSSGDGYWDETALNAILKTDRFPIDENGQVPSPMVIVMRPRD